MSGSVVFQNGEPAFQGTAVIFTSSDGMHSGYGIVQPGGEFCDVSFDEAGGGLPPGTYSISLYPPDVRSIPPEVARKAPPNFGIAPKYMVPRSSGLQLQLDDDTDGVKFVLEPSRLRGVSPGDVLNQLDALLK